ERQVPPQKALQAVATAAHGGRRNLGVGEQGLRLGVFEQGHPCRPQTGLPVLSTGGLVYPPLENGYSRTKEQQFRLFILFLVLTFLFAVAGLVTYAYTHFDHQTSAGSQGGTPQVEQVTQGDGSPAINNAGAAAGRDINVTVNPPPKVDRI